jgi:hypothetical protein
MDDLKELVEKVPPELKEEVKDYIEFLLKKKQKKKGKLKLDWAGGLSEFRDQYTSLELQKKALEWRGD